MSKAREAFYIGLFDTLPLLRDPMILILLSLLSFLPVLFVFVFGGAGANTQQALVGAIVLSLAFTGIASSQSVYFNKHWFRFQDILVASPVSPISYVFGISLGTFIVAVPAVLLAYILLLLGRPLDVLSVVLSLLVALALWISMLFAGFALGASTKNVRRANSLPQFVAILLGFLPPVYYPLSALDGAPIAQFLALLVPTTHAAQLAKHYLGLISISIGEIALGWAYLIGFAALMGFIALRRAHWTDP